MTQRRTLLAAAGGLLAAGPALAQQADPRMGLRAMGDASAPVTVLEFFSLTCSHCGAFHRDTWPRVRAELVQTGRVRMVWRDFPLDQVALRAHAVARAIILEAQAGGREFNVQATPTFVFGRRVVSGNIGFHRFAREAATP